MTSEQAAQNVACADSSSILLRRRTGRSRVTPALFFQAFRDSIIKLNPLNVLHNPVVFVAGSAATIVSILLLHAFFISKTARLFDLQIALWLWVTVLFANFAEALARLRGKAGADEMRRSRPESLAKKVEGRKLQMVPASRLCPGDVVLVEAGELIPVDGEVVDGIAIVDESVITGESAPVIRESGGSRTAVTCGTRVISDAIRVRVTAAPSETYLDRMMAVAESDNQQKTPNEVRLQTVLGILTSLAIALIAAIFIPTHFEVHRIARPSVISFIALVVCLVPTAAGALLPAVGIAGVDRLMQNGVLTVSRTVLETARGVKLFLIDKTGTVTSGYREAVEFLPFENVSPEELASAAQLASAGDETYEGRSIAKLARRFVPGDEMAFPVEPRIIPFSAFTRMSGIDLEGRSLRKGATSAIADYVEELNGAIPPSFQKVADQIARTGGTPLALADGNRVMGIIHLQDSVRPCIKERIEQLNSSGIRSILVTGDNPVTASAIASVIGITEVAPQATPADKLAYIKQKQAQGHVVAMAGDGTNDAPALAQADIGLVMSSGTPAAKEAGNMVDLENDPAKVLQVVAIARQIWVTRLAILTCSALAGLVQCAAVLPAMLAPIHPSLERINILHLAQGDGAVLPAVVCNAFLIFFLLPVALYGVRFHMSSMRAFLGRSMLIYVAAGITIPLSVLWLVNALLMLMHLG